MDAPKVEKLDHSWLSAPLRMLTRFVVRFPKICCFTGVLLCLLSIFYAKSNMGFKTSRLDLIDPQSSFNQLWIQYLEEFEADDDVVVLVEGKSQAEVEPVLEELYQLLREEKNSFYAILHERGLSKVREKGLHYLPLPELQKIEGELKQSEPILQGNWNQLGLEQTIFGLNQQLLFSLSQNQTGSTLQVSQHLGQITEQLSVGLSGKPITTMLPAKKNDALVALNQLDSDYFLANDGRLGMILLRLVKDDSQFTSGTGPLDRLKEIATQVELQHPEIDIGLTGLPVMENDEMQGSQRDTIKSSILSLIGVAVLFVAGFGGLRYPLLAVLTLLFGLIWSFGMLTLIVGHLNILSVSFGVILIGLGIDFGIHYVARYQLLRQQAISSDQALIKTASSIGPGILTGGITTAIAFFTAALTDFTGVAELGIIAGSGIMVCLLAAFVILPALLQMADAKQEKATSCSPLKVDRWVSLCLRFPRFTLMITVIACGLLAIGIPKLYYDHNLLNLQPENLESVQWERKLLSETDRSVWFALSITDDPDELLERKRKFESLEVVDRVEELASKFPEPDPQKIPSINSIHQKLQLLPEQPPSLSIPTAARLAQLLTQSKQILSDMPQENRLEQTTEIIRNIDRSRELLRITSQVNYRQIIASIQQRSAGELLNHLHSLKAVSNPTPPMINDLPEALVSRFIGKNNQYLLRIYPKGDIWDMDSLEQFVKEIRTIDLQATGQPVQTYYASRQMQQSYIEAAIYSLIAVMILLLIDFNNWRHMLLALVPVILGLLMLFGIQGLLDIPLNPANMIVLPLVLGIGIDDGVHVIHDFRRQSGRYRLGSSTATAVMITSLTTMIGFGSLMLADHRGLASLGRVLTLGVSCCLFTSLIVLPALLQILFDGEEDQSQENERTKSNSRPIKVVSALKEKECLLVDGQSKADLDSDKLM